MRVKIINILLKRQLIDKSRKNAIKNKFNLDLAYIDLNFVYINLDFA